MHQFVMTHLRLFKWLDLIVLSLVMGAVMYRFFSNAKATREGREVPPNPWFSRARIVLGCMLFLLLCAALLRL
jgi:hypothetical protein